MGTIADKLNLLLNTKAAIKAAIIGKGQTVADSDPFSAYPAKIQAIETGIQLPTLTSPGTAADLLAGKELIDQDGNQLTGTMPSLTEQTITPGVSDQVIAAGRYLSGEVTVSGDSNLVAANIKSGVNIFGVNGSFTGQYKFGYFSGINPYADKEFRISVDSDIAQVVGFAVKLTNNFEAIQNEMLGCIWWDNGTVNGGNMGIFNGGGAYSMTFNIFSSPIPIGGTSSNKYVQLMMPPNLNWSSSHAHEGFIVYKV